MEFAVNREQRVRALKRVQGVLSRKSNSGQSPSDVLLEADDSGRLRIGATDLEVTYDGYLNARVTSPGKVTVEGKRFFEVTSVLPVEDILIKTDDDNQMLIVTYRNNHYSLKMSSPDMYPELPSREGTSLVPIDGAVLRELVDRTMISVSTDNTRPMLNGVYFTCIGNGVVRLVSTDGHRLSQGERNASRDADIPARDGVIIPRKGINELKQFLSEFGREVSFAVAENLFVAAASDVTLYIQLIDAQFPDYKAVIPKKSERHLNVSRLDLLNSLRRIEILASERTHGIKIEITNGHMILKAENPDCGSAHEELEIEGYDGGDLSITFNSRYVSDILKILSSDKIEMALNEHLSPAIIREVGSEQYLFVVMPMRP